MASKKAKTVVRKEPETEQEWVEELTRSREHVVLCPPPTRGFQVGDAVYGQNAVVVMRLLDGKAYVVEHDVVDREKTVVGRVKRANLWYELFPAKTETTGFYHEELRLQTLHQDVAQVLHLVLWNGMDTNAPYQRGLVWGQEDRERLLDSVFAGRHIGTFVVRELPYTNESLQAGKPYIELVDGKQRLDALLGYYLGKYTYRGKHFHELDWRDRHHFLDCKAAVAELREGTTDEEALRAFLLLNDTGKPVAREHLAKVRAMLEAA